MTAESDRQYVPQARDILAEERRQVEREREAFADFRERIMSLESVDTCQATAGHTNGYKPVSDVDPPRGRLCSRSYSRQYQQWVVQSPADRGRPTTKRVRDAYRETVMSTPHYDDYYSESLETNMQYEFSQDVVEAILSDQPLTDHLRRSLVKSARLVETYRRETIEEYQNEAVALEKAENTLRRLERERSKHATGQPEEVSHDELKTSWKRLVTLEDDCMDLCRNRQEQLQTRLKQWQGREDVFPLCVHVYEEFPVTHPVLADAVALLKQLRKSRQETCSSLLTRLAHQ